MSDPDDYAHIHDAQSQRTRREMWVILAIVVVFIVGGLIWRTAAHVPPKPLKGLDPRNELSPEAVVAPAAAGVHAAPPPPRPVSP
jgi:hypothetical protein